MFKRLCSNFLDDKNFINRILKYCYHNFQLLLFFFVLGSVVTLDSCVTHGRQAFDDSADRTQVTSPIKINTENHDNNFVTLTAWSVPDSIKVNKPAILQVRLYPFIEIDEATLAVVSQSPILQILKPDSHVLRNMLPIKVVQDPRRSPPDPPALVVTYLSHFKIISKQAGTYKFTVKFIYHDEIQELEAVVVCVE